MAVGANGYDPYWTFPDLVRRQPGYATYGHRYLARRVHGVAAEDVSCECGYRPRRQSTDPLRAFNAHVKKYHPKEYAMRRFGVFVIHEDPDPSELLHV